MDSFRKWITKQFPRSAADVSPKNQTRPDKMPIYPSLSVNLQHIAQHLGNSSDLMIRRFRTGTSESEEAAIVYIEGIADTKLILEPLIKRMNAPTNSTVARQPISVEDLTERLILAVGSVKKQTDLSKLLQSVLSGDTAILFDGAEHAVLAATRKWKERSIEEPASEPVVRGPRDGFTETLRTNTGLIRRRIKDARLRVETLQIGNVTQTEVSVLYLEGIADPDVLQELHRRLESIEIDSILESGYIQEFITDQSLTLFPLVYSSERPDAIASQLLEGRIAVMVDGTPFVLIVPTIFTQFLQAAEDHYQSWYFATFIRLIRYAGLLITLLAPSIYISITTFHQEILPPELIMTLAAARAGVPFPAFVEAVIMEITFEVLREAGVRMPKTIGQAISIVGTLVIGQSAVEAGLVSPAMVIVVSLTAISNFVLPAYSVAISFRLLRFAMMALAAALGIYGIVLGLFLTVFHLCGLKSFGVPYLSTFAPFHAADQKDAIFRVPRWAMFSRPFHAKNRNYIRLRPASSSSGYDNGNSGS